MLVMRMAMRDGGPDMCSMLTVCTCVGGKQLHACHAHGAIRDEVLGVLRMHLLCARS